MFNFLDASNVGKEYNGFLLLKVEDIPDYKAKGVFLRHKRTGLEVYHLVKDDKENLFAFAFRTLAKDSKGTAHIMEHSTLCGSEKYPLKEPFATLASTSLNTFLNAMTYPDKTVYPGASVVRNDYFTMMDVYADSVFFPKLDHATFIQEGHRLEMDDKGDLSIQGVVYNEMKGNYSSFPQVAYSNLISGLFPDSYPAFDSGGDPLEIPNLTYEEFLDFHQKFYNPDNCLLFLYGDIPTGEQLDFINERYIKRLEEKYGVKNDSFDFANPLPIVKQEIKELQKLHFLEKSQEIHAIAPETGSTGNFVTMNWYSGIADMEKYFLSEVLIGNDSSPIAYALKESGLGDENCCGNFGQYREEFFTLGLMGVKKGNEQKVYDLIEKEIQRVYKEGVEQEDIDSALMGMDFNLREVNRYWGPQSITIMEKVLKGWQFGLECSNQLTPIQAFEKVKKIALSDPDYTKKLIKKYFIDPEICIKAVIEPSADYFNNRNKTEEKLIAKLEKSLDKAQLKKDLDELHAYQAYVETPEETACIPTTKLSSLDPKIDCPECELKFVEGIDGSQIPLFVSNEETNGLFYIDVLYPFDRVEPKYYKYIPFLTNVITNMGWNNKPWDDCISDSACVMGDVWGRYLTGFTIDVPDCQNEAKVYEKYNICGRNWIGLSCKALTSQSKESLQLLAEIITTMDFKDEKRFASLVQENLAEKKARLVSSGRELAMVRARAADNTNLALGEILFGVSQLYTVNEYAQTPEKETLHIFDSIYNECIKSGGIIHITADEDSLKSILPQIKDFAKNAKMTKLLPANKLELEDLLPYISQSELLQGDKSEQLLQVESQTGYAVGVSKASECMSKEAAAEAVVTSWLGMHSLWDKIRTTGGAYGANSWCDSGCRELIISSYRDPTPEKSVETFIEAFKEIAENPISAEDIEKTIVSIYGDQIVPQTPKDRGARCFEGILYGNPPKLRQKRVDDILQVKFDDAEKAAKRLYENLLNVYKVAIFCNKIKNVTSKIVKIPL